MNTETTDNGDSRRKTQANAALIPISNHSDLARHRLLSNKGERMVRAAWHNIVSFHFSIDPELLPLPRGFKLDLHEGESWVSVMALTMKRFRPCGVNPSAWLFKAISKQRFLNVHTYVIHEGEPGVWFFGGCLCQPFGFKLPSGIFGLPFDFAELNHEHKLETRTLRGEVNGKAASGKFAYEAKSASNLEFKRCARGSLSEFLLERYCGYYLQKDLFRVFRAWHPPWRQVAIDASVSDDNLVKSRHPWFEHARFRAAFLCAGFDEVWLGRTRGVQATGSKAGNKHHGLSSFYEMP